MTDYFIRCTQADIPAMRALGLALGILAQHEGQWFANAPHAYQELGSLHGADGMPILALDGQPYWHANLRFAGPSLLGHAQAVLAASPSSELATAIEPQNFRRFFVVDPVTGEATRPAQPAVVFA